MGDLARLTSLRLRILSNSIRQWREHSRLKILVILFFAVGFWFGLFAVFWEGFRFMGQMPDLKVVVVGVLFALFFMALGMMLTFSNGIIAFTSLFKSEETEYLFSCPLPAGKIFTYKLYEGIVFSSWAFLFLSAPMLAAFAVTFDTPWYFFPASVILEGGTENPHCRKFPCLPTPTAPLSFPVLNPGVRTSASGESSYPHERETTPP